MCWVLIETRTLKLGTYNTTYFYNTQESHVIYNIITKLMSKVKNTFNMI